MRILFSWLMWILTDSCGFWPAHADSDQLMRILTGSSAFWQGWNLSTHFLLWNGFAASKSPCLLQGTLLFWYNSDPSLDRNHLTYHAGCPVIKGHKWSESAGWLYAGLPLFLVLTGTLLFLLLFSPFFPLSLSLLICLYPSIIIFHYECLDF